MPSAWLRACSIPVGSWCCPPRRSTGSRCPRSHHHPRSLCSCSSVADMTLPSPGFWKTHVPCGSLRRISHLRRRSSPTGAGRGIGCGSPRVSGLRWHGRPARSRPAVRPAGRRCLRRGPVRHEREHAWLPRSELPRGARTAHHRRCIARLRRRTGTDRCRIHDCLLRRSSSDHHQGIGHRSR